MIALEEEVDKARKGLILFDGDNSQGSCDAIDLDSNDYQCFVAIQCKLGALVCHQTGECPLCLSLIMSRAYIRSVMSELAVFSSNL